ncbi:uncharacterized protein BJ171DRAFT_568418 [Polychytrium aggregatum]|uniref:uncharacterized protein n=1 Tax=Polychytrium aggregatum TaxID=110093 RepID=UPI0022FDD6E2
MRSTRGRNSVGTAARECSRLGQADTAKRPERLIETRRACSGGQFAPIASTTMSVSSNSSISDPPISHSSTSVQPSWVLWAGLGLLLLAALGACVALYIRWLGRGGTFKSLFSFGGPTRKRRSQRQSYDPLGDSLTFDHELRVNAGGSYNFAGWVPKHVGQTKFRTTPKTPENTKPDIRIVRSMPLDEPLLRLQAGQTTDVADAIITIPAETDDTDELVRWYVEDTVIGPMSCVANPMFRGGGTYSKMPSRAEENLPH